MPKILTQRELNRALLARQYLIERQPRSAAETVGHLVGMQAQAPDAPYVALWSRLTDYRTADLAAAVGTMEMVRLTLMRGTIHLVSAADALAMQPVFQPIAARAGSGSQFWSSLGGIDPADILAEAERLLIDKPMSRPAVGRLLAERWPDIGADLLGYAATTLLPTIQTPPRGVWRSGGPVTWTPIEAALGHQPVPPIAVSTLLLRYLTAFGPASLADMAKWSGLTGLRPVIEAMRPDLVTFRSPAGKELFDVPDGVFVDPETPAPPRFLPEYDNLILSHADRSRVMPQRGLPALPGGPGGATGTLRVDGMIAATWRITTTRSAATLAVVPFAPIDIAHHPAIEAEAAELLAFIHPVLTDRTIRFEEPREQKDPRTHSRNRRKDHPAT